MIYLMITAAVFFLDYGIKRYIDRKYAAKVRHYRFGKRIILEKYYNKGAALNFLAKKPEIMKYLHTLLMLCVAVYYYRLLRVPGKRIGKLGTALLTGGGLSNLFDRYREGHVIDYFRINAGPKGLRRIIFNISDFFIFIGAVASAAGSQ